jgi:uncharacterized protein YaaQ
VRAILNDRDLDYLADKLVSQHERLVTCLKSEGNLAYFKVSDLKLLIGYLKAKLKKNIKISGNKCDLTQRIAEELFPSGGGSGYGSEDGSNAGPTQTTLRYDTIATASRLYTEWLMVNTFPNRSSGSFVIWPKFHPPSRRRKAL